MKLKATFTKGVVPLMHQAVEQTHFRRAVLDQVLKRHLRTGDLGPAEFYIQLSDFTVPTENPTELMCEVKLSGVSVNMRRAGQDFVDAREALEILYKDTLQRTLRKGQRMQLMVSLAVDRPPLDMHTTLIEREGEPAVWLEALPDAL